MSARQRLLDALTAAGCQPRGNAARCPAHDDRNASLSIGAKTNGDAGAVVKCHAGCHTEDILAALGLRRTDLFDAPKKSGPRRIVATYDYCDEHGTMLFQKVRYDPKDFRQRHMVGREWVWNLNGTRRVLYNLPELLTATGPVYLAEGEKDADALTRAGVTATAWTEGAWKPGTTPKWRPEYTDALKGRHVVIVRDRDESGRHTAATIAGLIEGAAASVRIVEPVEGKDAADHLAAGRTVDELADVISDSSPVAPVQKRTPVADDDEKPEKQSAAAVLVELAMERYRFGVSLEGEPFGVAEGGHIIRPLRGGKGSLRAELARAYLRTTGKVAAQQALADALLALEGEAQDAEPEPVYLRVAEHEGVLWVDLGDATQRVVRITGARWEVVAEGVPVLFRRTALTGAFPTPEPGDLAELWELLNVATEDRPLVLAWLVAALALADVPHPVLNVNGEQGTGKSTASRLLVELVDPSPVPLRKPPRDMDSWVTAAAGSWVVGIDNLSAIPDWLSDTLCRAVTGDGDVRRQLYTDAGLSVFSFRRVVLLNGIDLGGLRGDLSERLLNVSLSVIDEDDRRTETEMQAAWAAAWPRLFGALLSVVAGVKSALPSVRLAKKPRMADFAAVLHALDDRHGTHGLARYLEQTKTLAADSLTSDPFIARMMQTIDEPFEGTAAELLAKVAPAEDRPPKGWPGNARAVTGLLKRHAPALRKVRWTVEDLGNRNEAGVTRWSIRPEIACNPSPSSPFPGGDTLTDGETGNTGNEYGQSQDDNPCRLHPDAPLPGCWSCDQRAAS